MFTVILSFIQLFAMVTTSLQFMHSLTPNSQDYVTFATIYFTVTFIAFTFTMQTPQAWSCPVRRYCCQPDWWFSENTFKGCDLLSTFNVTAAIETNSTKTSSTGTQYTHSHSVHETCDVTQWMVGRYGSIQSTDMIGVLAWTNGMLIHEMEQWAKKKYFLLQI